MLICFLLQPSEKSEKEEEDGGADGETGVKSDLWTKTLASKYLKYVLTVTKV